MPALRLPRFDAATRRRLLLAADTLIVLAIAAPRLWAAWFDHGTFWPDEVYQTLEQGHRFAFGYGLIPWEFREGARSWLTPGAMGVVFKIGGVFLHSGLALSRLVKTCVAAGSVLAGVAAMRVADRIAGRAARLATGLVFASLPVLVYFGARCLTDTVSTPLVTWAALLVAYGDRASRRVHPVLLAGALAGLAVFCRYQNGVVLVAMLVVLLARRAWLEAARFAGAAAVIGALGGALDWITWGKPFASFIYYFRFSVIEGKQDGWGREPAAYYFHALLDTNGWGLAVLAVGFLVAAIRAPGIALVVAAHVGAHLAVPLKQQRFLLPVVPLFVAMGASGLALAFDFIAKQVERRASRFPGAQVAASVTLVAALALAIPFSLRLPHLTFAALGDRPRGNLPAWGHGRAPSILLSAAGQRADLCGLAFSDFDWGYTGGYSYLHKRVPLFHHATDAAVASSNYLIAPRGAHVPKGYVAVETSDTFQLYLRAGACAPPPAGWTSKLEW